MTSSSVDELLPALARETEDPLKINKIVKFSEIELGIMNKNINSINRTKMVSPRSFRKKIERKPSTTTFGDEKNGQNK